MPFGDMFGKREQEKKSQTAVNTERLLSLPIDEVYTKLESSSTGLSAKQAKQRLEECGPNEFARRKRRTIIMSFLQHFKNPLILILIFAASISGFFGQVVNVVIILSMVLLSVVLDVVQESKAERAAELLEERVSTTAALVRDNIKKEIRISQIVPGDIIHLSAGDMVPADARVITARDLFINQSALTGESFPVEKFETPIQALDGAITEWNNCMFMGTSVVSGTATAIVLRTGKFTEYGKIAEKLVDKEAETESEKGLRQFGFLIMQITVLLVLSVFFVNAVFKRSVLESLLFAVALAVGLTPELLPMVISLNLSKSAIEMSRKGVIVKRLTAVQNLGSMDVLCTDKTGTLTENMITLVKYINLEGRDDQKVLLYSYLNSFHQTGIKSPFDEAILRRREIKTQGYDKIDEIPFDFNRKRISIVVERNGQQMMLTKGAPEELFKICPFYEHAGSVSRLTIDVKKKLEQMYHKLSSEGYRVLAVSYKKVKGKKVYAISDESDMVLHGFVAFIDPPKHTARESLQMLAKSGIHVKVLTGDNEFVTKRICDELGFEVKGVLLGADVEGMTDDALSIAAENANIFARVTPVQKERIIIALKKKGHAVGFLGDGINDAPPLKIADVGVSVDNAVDVAKESADIILLQKDLKVLKEGVMDGRKTFANTIKYIVMSTSSNFGNMFSVAIGSLFLPFLPMLPIQILLNNFLYDFSQSTIPTDNVDKEYIERPRRWDIPFIKRFMIILGPISSVFDLLTYAIMILVFHATEPLFQTAWFLESLTTQTLVIFAIRTRVTPFWKSRPSKLLLISSLAVVAVAFIIPYTQLGDLFGFTQLPYTFLLMLAGMVVVYVFLVEIVKRWFYKKYGNA